MISVMHDSRSLFYRRPFGALTVGGKINLSLDIRGELPEKVQLRLWHDDEQFFDMILEKTIAGKHTYSVETVLPSEPCLVWYYFKIISRGRVLYYGNNLQKLGGRGKLYDHEPPSYQITVYKQSALPKWLKGGMIYQIFPDRFFNPYDKPLALKPDSLCHDDWNRAPLYARDRQTAEILAYDFFGGNLDGITAKLDYLQDFGVTLIYLNPIFLSVSNHRFDTGDYEQIDPVLGDLDAFARLCAEAKKRGIYIMLDGVFSHTGSDSRYFNKEGTYDELGAYQSNTSPFYNWYRFKSYPDDYECWWDIGNLPNVNELQPDYLNYMIESENSIAVRWLKAGAIGWRLDVADELPEEFIRLFRKRLKQENPESFLLGEVWEDASNKAAYGSVRCYFHGDQLDSVMNYPFRESVLAFLRGEKSSYLALRQLYSLYENYPKENFALMMNLLGTHDTKRLLTELSGVDESNFTDAQKRKYKLNCEQKALAYKRLWLALIWQMTFCGLPGVYYGDEAGLQGFADPFNRGTYPWDREEEKAFQYYWRLSRIRRRYLVLRHGTWKPLLANSEMIAYGRYYEEDKAIILLNRSESTQKFTLKSQEAFADILSGEVFEAGNERVTVTNAGNQGRILHNKIKYPDRVRKAGILLHPTSLPSEYGIGDLGTECYSFIDFLSQTGQGIWQILPLTTVDEVGSPYSGDSAFAGNTLLISPEVLVSKGLLREEELSVVKAGQQEQCSINFAAVKKRKEVLFKQAHGRFKPDKKFESFCQLNSFWLDDYALFCSLKKHFGGLPWLEWPQALKQRQKEELLKWQSKLAKEMAYHKFLQYEFCQQWSVVKAKANSRGIVIIGDVPMYLAHDSADIWVHQKLFELDETGQATAVAGVPPDYFSETGQLWGNPLYNWQECKREDYCWWKSRIERNLQMVNIVRLDHFRGFESYWRIPAGEKTAITGNWAKGPAEEFFLALQKHFQDLPFIAEDLGVITPAVNRLRDRFSLPGTEVLQFDFSGDIAKILYTGTHDNDTLLGFAKNKQNSENFTNLANKAGISDTMQSEQHADLLLKFVYESRYVWVVVPLQDLLGLDSNARMNTPSTVSGNWCWRFLKEDLNKELCDKASFLVKLGNREKVKNIDEIIYGM